MPQIAISIDIFKWDPLLRGANNPSVELLTFKDSLRDEGLVIEKDVTWILTKTA